MEEHLLGMCEALDSIQVTYIHTRKTGKSNLLDFLHIQVGKCTGIGLERYATSGEETETESRHT